jgi:hypothetical protein
MVGKVVVFVVFILNIPPTFVKESLTVMILKP